MQSESRVLSLFLDLILINSPSKRERRLADYIVYKLERLGASRVLRDTTGEFIGGDCGNVIAKFPGAGSLASAPPVLLMAHMDTVEPTEGLNPILSDGYVKSDGRTILGGDDKAGVAVILSTLEELFEEQGNRRPVELLFTVAEEIGLYGAKYVDINLFEAREAVALDSGGPVGSIVTKSPAQDELNVVFIGRAAHAGVEPERGVSAIRAAAEAIASMQLGRIDEETTANIGVIHGGSATNIIPEQAEIKGEARSRNEGKLTLYVTAMQDSCRRAAERIGAKVEMKVERSFAAMNVDEEHGLVQRFKDTASDLNLIFSAQSRGGGSDANVLNGRGFVAVNMGVGMELEHSTQERISIDNLEKAVRYLKAFLRR